jgi:hypothetical protein
MLSLLPRHSDWVLIVLSSPVVSAFPAMADRSACATSFSRPAQRLLTLGPAHSRCHQFVTPFTGGFNHFVTSTVAPVASGWSDCRVGLSPTGKRRLVTAHAITGRQWRSSPQKRIRKRSPHQSSAHLRSKPALFGLCILQRAKHPLFSPRAAA